MRSNAVRDTAATNSLLAAAMRISPTGKEQETYSVIVNTMRMDCIPEKDIQIELLGSLLDGLKYGNWPIDRDKDND